MGSIDDALAGRPQPEHNALQRLIDIARRVAPHAVDGVSHAAQWLRDQGWQNVPYTRWRLSPDQAALARMHFAR